MKGYICSAPLYEYEYEGKVWRFEFPAYGGPWQVRKDGKLFKRAPGPNFYDMFKAFRREPDREQFRVGGGCQRF